jgi:hypothetical protein
MADCEPVFVQFDGMLHTFVSKTASFALVVCFPKGFAVKLQDGSRANLDIGCH